MPQRAGKLTIATLLVSLLTAPSASFAQATAPSPEVSIRKFLQATVEEDKESKFLFALVDLNHDGKQEAVVYLLHSDWCGSGGCTLFVLAPTASSYMIVSTIDISSPPIRVLTTTTNGWNDLAVHIRGGDARLTFDGKTYPDNPTVPPAIPLHRQPAGMVIIPSTDQALPLFP